MLATLLFSTLLGGTPEPSGVEGMNRLQPRQVSASSSLQNGWNSYDQNYLAQYAVDDDPSTAWVEGSPGDGKGESFIWRGPELMLASKVKISIRNGYQKSKALYGANARVKELHLEALGAKDGPPMTKDVKVADDSAGWQTFEFPVSGPFSGLKLTVTAVYPGARYTDLCISDVRVYVTAKDAFRPEREAAAFEVIKPWAAERQARAKQGLKPQPGYFVGEYARNDDVKDAAAIQKSAREAVASLTAALAKAPNLPDGWRSAKVQPQRGREVDFGFLQELEYWVFNGSDVATDVFGQLISADLVAWDDAPKRPTLAAAKAMVGMTSPKVKCRALFGDEPGLYECLPQAEPGDDAPEPSVGVKDVERLIGWSKRRMRGVHGDLKTFDAVARLQPGFYGEREVMERDGATLVHYVDGHADTAVIDESSDGDPKRARTVFVFKWKGDVVTRVCLLSFLGDEARDPLKCVEPKG